MVPASSLPGPDARARQLPVAPRRRRPLAWIGALALASFLAPCHAPLAEAAAGALPFACLFPG